MQLNAGGAKATTAAAGLGDKLFSLITFTAPSLNQRELLKRGTEKALKSTIAQLSKCAVNACLE